MEFVCGLLALSLLHRKVRFPNRRYKLLGGPTASCGDQTLVPKRSSAALGQGLKVALNGSQ